MVNVRHDVRGGQGLGREAAEIIAKALPLIGREFGQSAASIVAEALPEAGRQLGVEATRILVKALPKITGELGVEAASTLSQALASASQDVAQALPIAGRACGADAMAHASTIAGVALIAGGLCLAVPLHTVVCLLGGVALVAPRLEPLGIQLPCQPQQPQLPPPDYQARLREVESRCEALEGVNRALHETLSKAQEAKFKCFIHESQKLELLEQVYCILRPTMMFQVGEDEMTRSVAITWGPQARLNRGQSFYGWPFWEAAVRKDELWESLKTLNQRRCWSAEVQSAIAAEISDCTLPYHSGGTFCRVLVCGPGNSLEQKLKKLREITWTRSREISDGFEETEIKQFCQQQGFLRAFEPDVSSTELSLTMGTP